MKNKSKKKLVFAPQRYFPGQINELAMCCFIINKDKLTDLHEFVVNNGGRIISAIESRGVSRAGFIDFLSGEVFQTYTVLCLCQSEIADILMLAVCKEFNLNKKGKGKAFKVDILGYMGAKGPFVE